MEIGTDINKAKAFLEKGELVSIPTETVYGLAANGLRPDAISKIFAAKKRPAFNPLILHLAYTNEAKKYASYFPEAAQRLATQFWPGPLTLVLPKQKHIPDLLTAGQATVALRVPQHPLTLQLLRSLDFPLAAPSANPSGYISPTEAAHVADQMADQIKYILDGGKCSLGIESTIVKCDGDDVILLRSGIISIEEIENCIDQKMQQNPSTSVEAPGMLLAHYTPHKKFLIGDIAHLVSKHPTKNIGILSFMPLQKFSNAKIQLSLSPKGDLTEAAQNLFSYLRSLDKEDIELIIGEWMPENGIGIALNDRLRRATFLSPQENKKSEDL